jgi:hypothetical protein
MPRLIAWVARVPQPVGVHAVDAGGAADAGDGAFDDEAVERAAVIGDQAMVGADVFEVRGGPLGEQVD